MEIDLAETEAAKLLGYLALLEKWNKAFNLTALRDPAEMVPRHLLDSLSILPWVGEGPLLDVGTGAGLPGIVLAIMRPQLECTLLDTNGKKIRFVQQAAMALELTNVNPTQERIERFERSRCYSQITARAFASLGELVRLSAPLLESGGEWLAMKGVEPREEIERLRAEGLQIEVSPLKVAQTTGERCLVVMRQKDG
jgi:16S rRNA (guanine527-N7)-methyltransferase